VDTAIGALREAVRTFLLKLHLFYEEGKIGDAPTDTAIAQLFGISVEQLVAYKIALVDAGFIDDQWNITPLKKRSNKTWKAVKRLSTRFHRAMLGLTLSAEVWCRLFTLHLLFKVFGCLGHAGGVAPSDKAVADALGISLLECLRTKREIVALGLCDNDWQLADLKKAKKRDYSRDKSRDRMRKLRRRRKEEAAAQQRASQVQKGPSPPEGVTPVTPVTLDNDPLILFRNWVKACPIQGFTFLDALLNASQSGVTGVTATDDVVSSCCCSSSKNNNNNNPEPQDPKPPKPAEKKGPLITLPGVHLPPAQMVFGKTRSQPIPPRAVPALTDLEEASKLVPVKGYLTPSLLKTLDSYLEEYGKDYLLAQLKEIRTTHDRAKGARGYANLLRKALKEDFAQVKLSQEASDCDYTEILESLRSHDEETITMDQPNRQFMEEVVRITDWIMADTSPEAEMVRILAIQTMPEKVRPHAKVWRNDSYGKNIMLIWIRWFVEDWMNGKGGPASQVLTKLLGTTVEAAG
jgi:hypothetical protein